MRLRTSFLATLPLVVVSVILTSCGSKSREVAVISTSAGDIVVGFFDKDAHRHVENFKKLAREGFYEGTTFHRVIPGFMIQGGDPNSKDADRANDGMGGPSYEIPAEINMPHKRGTLAAARMGDEVNPERRSSGSQFFICVADAPFLDGKYSAFGEVLSGMDVVDKIVAAPRDDRDNPITPVTINKVTLRPAKSGETR
ncbi:MAG TPA: peptidylprolyl isomerase [Candidatus Latescibacteria bacterium]|nr:peptidylprolyl isomerase [Candidatus Latescibacterota bacterium]